MFFGKSRFELFANLGEGVVRLLLIDFRAVLKYILYARPSLGIHVDTVSSWAVPFNSPSGLSVN